MAQGIRRDAPGEKRKRNHKGGDKYGAPRQGTGFLLPAGKYGKSDGVKSAYGDLWSLAGRPGVGILRITLQLE